MLNSKENNSVEEILKKVPKKRGLDENDIIIGVIVQTTDKIAIVNIDYRNQHVLSPSATGIIFIKEVSKDYVEKIGDVLRIGDIIKARVIEKDKFGFKLSISDKDLGVIKSNCRKCKTELKLTRNEIKCLKCNTINTKKIGKM
jgi:exosome complex component CSL4